MHGPLFPKPAQVIVAILIGSSVKLVGKRTRSNLVDVPILTKEQLALLTASPAHESFDGDARKFCLGIEAMRLWLAYGYDPYFSLDTHIKGVLCAINAAFKGMIAKKKGHTVNLGSVASRVAIPNGAVYWGTKFAVAAISKALRKEVAADGIRVAIIK